MQEMTIEYDEGLTVEELATEESAPETGEEAVNTEPAMEVDKGTFGDNSTLETHEATVTLQAQQDENLPVDRLTEERRLKSWRYRDKCGEERTFVLLQDGRRLRPRQSRATEELRRRHEGAKHDQWVIWDFVPITALVLKFRKTHLAAMPEFAVLQCPERITEAQRERLQLIFEQLKKRWETKWQRRALPIGGTIPRFECGWLKLLNELTSRRHEESLWRIERKTATDNKIRNPNASDARATVDNDTEAAEQSNTEADGQLRGQMLLEDFCVYGGGEAQCQ